MKAYLDFEIQISALDAGRYVLSVSGPGGDARHTITLPLGDPTYEELAARLGRFDTDEAGLVELGQILFRALFQGPIKDVYTRSQSAIKSDQGLRLRFNIGRSLPRFTLASISRIRSTPPSVILTISAM